MPGCGKGKYLTEICWKLLIFASEPLISCILSININFCDFLENTQMHHVFNQNIFPRDLKKALKCPKFARKMVYFKSPIDLSSFFQWKRLFWTDFLILPSEPIFTQQFQSKNCSWSGSSPKRNSIFFLSSVSNWSKIIISNFFINTSQ